MSYPYTVEAKHTLDMNGGVMSRKAIDTALALIQEHGEVYIRNASTQKPPDLWAEHIQKLDLREGDVLFVSADAVDWQALQDSKLLRVPVVAIQPLPGQTVADCLAVARQAEVPNVPKT